MWTGKKEQRQCKTTGTTEGNGECCRSCPLLEEESVSALMDKLIDRLIPRLMEELEPRLAAVGLNSPTSSTTTGSTSSGSALPGTGRENASGSDGRSMRTLKVIERTRERARRLAIAMMQKDAPSSFGQTTPLDDSQPRKRRHGQSGD